MIYSVTGASPDRGSCSHVKQTASAVPTISVHTGALGRAGGLGRRVQIVFPRTSTCAPPSNQIAGRQRCSRVVSVRTSRVYAQLFSREWFCIFKNPQPCSGAWTHSRHSLSPQPTTATPPVPAGGIVHVQSAGSMGTPASGWSGHSRTAQHEFFSLESSLKVRRPG